MALHSLRANPVQACKLLAIVAVLLFTVAGIYGVIPGQGLTSLFLVVALSVGLALVVAAETVWASYRLTVTDTGLRERLTSRPLLSVARATEAVSVVVAVTGFVLLINWLPDEPPAGPGAIGVLFIVTGLSLVVVGGSLVRTLTEFYDHRRTGDV